jgi:two-component system phosphate regulon sensor histidine kinase PhoR
MAAWVVAGALLIAVALLAWRLGAAHRQALQLRRELAAAQRDLENTRQAEQSLHAWQTSVGSAVEEALLTLDTAQHVVWANEKSVKLFGASVGKSLIEATRLYDLETLVADTFHATEPMERRVTLNGSTYLARTALLGRGNLVLALQDVSEVQRLGRARRDFVANISHELRTPLASIRLLVETLQAGALSNPPVASEMLSKINIEMDALSQLARELLDLALIESGQMPLKLQRTDLHDLAQTQMQRFTPQAQQKQQTLDVDIPAGMCALADGEMIGRVLSNLLHNACKFAPSGGRISVSAHLDQDDVTLSVTDTGPGIPPEDLARIFERFYKVDRARGQSGTGLGLAIARHIVEGHGGRIWAESSLGHGATFRFTLPAC